MSKASLNNGISVYSQIPSSELKRLASTAQEYFIAHGMIKIGECPEEFKKYNEESEYILFGFSLCLFPYKFSQHHFDKVNKLADYMGILYHKISNDHSFIKEALGKTTIADDFMKGLFDIYKRSLNEPHAPQNIYSSIQRSDYMLHNEEEEDGKVIQTIQQIEVNTISCSFVNLSSKVPKYFRYIMRAFPHIYKDYDYKKVILNDSKVKGCEALVNAHNAFIQQRKLDKLFKPNEKIIIVMVTQAFERNCIDLRGIEYTVLEKFNVEMRSYSFFDLSTKARLNENFDLVIDDFGEEAIVSLAYFRSSYTPRDFNSQSDWDVRLMIEKSSAVKCPNLPTQLVGAKKVQQFLCEAGVLERLFPNDPVIVKELRSCFTNIIEVNRHGKENIYIEEAIREPEKYILKPQREGGGNMVFGEEMQNALRNWSDDKLDAYILMKRILPKPVDNILVFHKNTFFTKTISEFGVFQEVLAVNGEITKNQNFGFLIRSKSTSVQDGGVVAGNASLDAFYIE